MRPKIELAEELDAQVAQPNHYDAFERSMGQWSRTVRGAIGLPITTLAKRMRISKQAVSRLERNEAEKTISIAKLEALADALHCDFVYGFVPRTPFAGHARELQAEQDHARKGKHRIHNPK